MLARGGQRAGLRQLAGELRGHRLRREVVDGRRVPVPGGVAGEPGDVGEEPRLDPAVGVRQRALRQLVEDDVDDRGGRARRPRHGTALATGAHEVAHRGERQQQDQDDQGRGGEHGGERPQGVRARVQRRDAGAHRDRDRDGEARAAERVAQRRQHERRRQRADEHELRRPSRRGAGAAEGPDQPGTGQGRHEGVAQGEHQDVARRAPSRDEELGVAAEEVEQRLRERERP